VRRGTLSLSWGPYGGFYVTRVRICLGFVAITLIRNYEIEDMMEALVGAFEAEQKRQPLDDLLSSCKQWRQATESRLRLVTNREMSDSLLAPDKALFDAIEKAEEKS
jgi:hypothetical protein